MIVVGFYLLPCSGQFGIRANYGLSSAPNWEVLAQNSSQFAPTDFFGGGYSLGLDYWLRLPQKRIEFYPELRYTAYETQSQVIALSQDVSVNSTLLGFYANTHFYVMDFLGDCDCPTFSKQGGLFKKGFFLSLSPGVYYHKKSSDLIAGNLESISGYLGVGLGLDIGVSDLITVTPTVQYALGFNDNLDGAAEILGVPELQNFETSSFRQLLFGIRIGLRPDYKN